MKKNRYIVFAAAIAAAYTALTALLAPFSFGIIQVRVAESLTLLAAFNPVAIPGLFVGCLISNILTGNLIDIVFGSVATLLAAIATYGLRKKRWLAPMPPVVINALVVGFYLTKLHGGLLWLNILSIAAGQFVACYIIPAYFIINFGKTQKIISHFLNS